MFYFNVIVVRSVSRQSSQTTMSQQNRQKNSEISPKTEFFPPDQKWRSAEKFNKGLFSLAERVFEPGNCRTAVQRVRITL